MNVLGIDPSLTATGLALVSSDWGLSFKSVIVGSSGFALPEDAPNHKRVVRIMRIGEECLEFAKLHHAQRIVIEDFAYSANDQFGVREVAGLGWHLRIIFAQARLPVCIVSEASARTLLGKQPRSGRKTWARKQLRKAGAPSSWSEDQFDAFVCANWGLSAVGAALIMRDQGVLDLQPRRASACG